ncbi:MAG: sn-glycerol-3-phosphate ABC transporter ATP-binding protein UgpC [Calditrichaceae bacterium]|nr:sn-glycerol-3-phosphate ABC transporter ATP-binding protein UgpC [Calditrichaceae bacterium]
MASVKLTGVNKTYDGKTFAVKNADLTIKDKEFLVLVGPSGCGKSTLLRMIAGLEEITSGTVEIGDRVVNNIPPKDRNIAMVFQNYALYPHMTVFENMAFGLKLRKYPKEEIKKRVEEAADLLELTEYLDRKPKALSGGQRQRVAVGRAIVRKPDVFLFDEPLSNLDAKLRVQMRIELIKLHKKLETTVIYVTHDQVEAMTMGSRIVILNKGEIQQIDTPMNVYQKPANLFAAGFIGSPAMNFMEGQIIRDNGLCFKAADFRVSLSPEKFSGLESYIDKKAVLGIRPEHISLTEYSGTAHALKAVIEVIEPMGGETNIYLKSDTGRIVCKRQGLFSLPLQTEVYLEANPENISIFDIHSGKSIRSDPAP